MSLGSPGADLNWETRILVHIGRQWGDEESGESSDREKGCERRKRRKLIKVGSQGSYDNK